VGSTEMAEERSWMGRGGDVPLPAIYKGPGGAVSSPGGVRGDAAAAWRFRTFYKLTKLLLVSVLQMLNLFQ